VSGVEQLWRRRRLTPALYDFGVERERIARVGGRLMWGTDVRPLYASFAEFDDLPSGGAVLDVPCGGGVAFRGLPRASGLRYVAADLSPLMLRRARAEAARRRLRIGFAQVSVDRLPFPDGSFDLCATYNGLHCFPDPAGAVAEMARVLRPGGMLRGSAIVTGEGARQDALIRLIRRRGEFGTVGSAADLHDWLTGAGLSGAEVTCDGAVARFRAVNP
jgi:SAM-dependent methyltransferase